MSTINRLAAAITAASAIAGLAGCADADIAAMRSRAADLANTGMARFAPPAPVIPPQVAAYEAFVQRETAMLEKLTQTVISPAGRSWDYQLGSVTYQYLAMQDAKQMVHTVFTPPVRFLVDLPADAVRARDAAAADLVQQLAAVAASRLEPSEVAVAAPSQADRTWLRTQAEIGLARVNPTGKTSIHVIEMTGPYRAGFISEATSPVVRTVSVATPTRNQ